MNDFLKKHEASITGTISVTDRLILKGYLPMSYPEAAERFFALRGILLKEFKDFTKAQTETLKVHAQAMAKKENRPYEYLNGYVRKEEYVRKIAERDGITEGLICVLAMNEENHTFTLRYGEGRPRLKKSSPRCLTLYFYYLDRHFGFMHVRVSTWLPFSIQVYVNGHDWLARQLTTKGVSYRQVENAFVSIADCGKAQAVADRFPTLPWEKILHVFARRVNPLFKTILKGMEYYWVIDQAEYATDVMFRNHDILDELYLNWQKHAAVCTQAEDVMRFMGRKLHGSFNSVIQTDAKYRPTVTRIKHVMRGNWIKMYNKQGIVLRVETVINRPREFRISRTGRGKKAVDWFPMPKRVSSMKRYGDICLRANRAYLQALAQVDNPAEAYRQLDGLCEPQKLSKQRIRGLNPLRERDRVLFEAVVRGEHFIKGFQASDLAWRLAIIRPDDPVERKRCSAKLNRKLRLLRGHGLIVRISRSRRYKITDIGIKLMNAALHLRTTGLPEILNKAA
ncbi:MAG: hypothetical protein A2350_19510 [Candidatus Raymondbacteria bacterium RifOxyB12_full_50_8]|uniref:Uncharacterized protein n=1 Tax=Candidatus Raymondbacteria bacterium RIFOXYD12_FULL_49_13 TaxID=1817890 RepID=A0A1F7FA16_UNCRA|nr:MAG: hypothetical protein A2248_22410 [Candidatus Raymondbacteria bacterium RIFOXYA2_FULL_49_16]OGJ93994.1 MAG: hypothetical protein A2350_19510 [Candidatus Raymondbacteria bacterium RifOxyB12_full_50_8]OGK03519.1 MAG: hypothetical protein A2519_09805 [Candidatus Raymondbacteria bacterium RIFOXYD12_FULL_49_13]OGP42808.1 MAG: hypothetical protein A2324_15995 [Candidatus Raymondbacteria bacterium RIFOXYB2_FULL_49_35]